MITCTRKIEFDAGHRLVGHESKCANVHGHRYVAEITCQGDLDSVGRVLDFSCIKEIVGGWVDEHWDHTFIANKRDPLLDPISASNKKPIYIMDVEPTSEHMAVHLHYVAYLLLEPRDVLVRSVRLYETPNCYSDSDWDEISTLLDEDMSPHSIYYTQNFDTAVKYEIGMKIWLEVSGRHTPKYGELAYKQAGVVSQVPTAGKPLLGVSRHSSMPITLEGTPV